MTDRELIELAAKAAWIQGEYETCCGLAAMCHAIVLAAAAVGRNMG